VNQLNAAWATDYQSNRKQVGSEKVKAPSLAEKLAIPATVVLL
jgi:hypothetical protein